MKGFRKLKVSPEGELYASESVTQISCVRWFRIVYARLGKHLFSIPNGARIGGKMNKKGFPIMASILKAEGMTAGVSDLFLAYPVGGFHGLFIEMKTPVGEQSDDQREFLELMASVGYAVTSCLRQADFEKDVTDYLNSKFVQTPVWVKVKKERKIKSVKVLAG